MLYVDEFSAITILTMILLSYIQCYSMYLKYKHVSKCMQSLIRIRLDGAENKAIKVGHVVQHGGLENIKLHIYAFKCNLI